MKLILTLIQISLLLVYYVGMQTWFSIISTLLTVQLHTPTLFTEIARHQNKPTHIKTLHEETANNNATP